MKKVVFYYSITPMHVGSGSSLGVVDLPIYRESHTNFPAIPSSAIKGVFRANYNKGNVTDIFGSEDSGDRAGSVIFTDAKILLFPVKSAKGVFVWITCPLVLDRLKRDTGITLNFDYNLSTDSVLVSSEAPVINGNVILEEFSFQAKKEDRLKDIKNIVKHDIDESKIVIVPDDIFTFFVKNYTEVVARIKIDQEKGTVKEGGLRYQELVPAETIYYGVITSVKNMDTEGSKLKEISEFINNKTFQFGGDETLGRGFTKICVVEV